MEIYLRREKRGRSGGGEGGGWVGMIISVCCFWQFDFETLLRRERERDGNSKKFGPTKWALSRSFHVVD